MSSPSENYAEVEPTGSPPSGEPVFLAVGRLGKTHGVSGEITMQVVTDFPERLRSGTRVYIGPEHKPHAIQSLRWHGNRLLLRFAEYPDRESVAALRNQWVLVYTKDRPPLPDGEFYHHELLGLQVRTDEGKLLGTIKEILETGANDVFIVKSTEGKEILIPATDEVILRVDLESRVVRVVLIPGLL